MVNQLELERFRGTTRKNYWAIWRNFNKFIVKLDDKPEFWEERLTLFVAHLVNEKKQSKTIKSYISAIKAILTENKIDICEDKYLLTAMTKACKIKNDRALVRFPIHKCLLHVLLDKIEKKYGQKQPYLAMLYRAIFVTAYYGMFRVGELTEGEHVIKAKDVYIATNKCRLLFILHSSKTHSEGDPPQSIKISASSDRETHNVSDEKTHCPFKILRRYMQARKGFIKRSEQFFVFRDRSPVKPTHFRKLLKSILENEGYNDDLYNCHSFRIGRSQDLWELGISLDLIKKLGRWSGKSSAIYKYLR